MGDACGRPYPRRRVRRRRAGLCRGGIAGAVAIGIDPDPAMLAAARSRAAMAGLKVIVSGRTGRAASLSRRRLRCGRLGHRSLLCAGCRRRRSRDGARAAAGRAPRARRARAMELFGRRFAALRGWLGSATWKAARFRTATELRALAEQAGLSVTAIRGAVYLPAGRPACARAGANRSVARPPDDLRCGVHRAVRSRPAIDAGHDHARQNPRRLVDHPPRPARELAAVLAARPRSTPSSAAWSDWSGRWSR